MRTFKPTQHIMLYIFIYIFLFLTAPVIADEPRSALDGAPSVDATAKGTPAAANLPIGNKPDSASNVKDDAVPVDAGNEPPEIKPEAQESYVYDLKKLIIKSRENIKRVNDKIKEQAVIKRNQKREERAREYYERGVKLQEEGKLDEAREYFEKAVRITDHPEMSKYIQQSEFKLRAQTAALRREEKEKLREQQVSRQTQQQEAKETYDEAVRLYKEKKFQEAKDKFDHVEELVADYKATRSYLKIIDQDIIKSEALAQKQQSQEMERQQKEAEVARQREKEEWRKEIDLKEKQRAEQVNKQAQDVYEQAVALYKGKKYAEAKKKFQEVEWVIPDYKATHNYLARVDNDIAQLEKDLAEQKSKQLAQQQWEEEVAKRKKEAEEKREAEAKAKALRKQLEDQAAFIYQAAINLYDKKSYDEALEKFNDIEKTVPGFKSSRVYVAKISQIKENIKKRKLIEEEKAKQEELREAREKEEAAAKEKKKQLEDETMRLYETAVDLYNHHQLDQAKTKFNEANSKIAGFKRIDSYLKRIDDQLAKDKQKSKESEKQADLKQVIVKQQPVKVKAPAVVGASPVALAMKPALTDEQQKEEARQIDELAKKSAEMFERIAAMSQDRRMAPAKKKMEQVDQILNNLKAQKETILRQIREDEERQRQKEIQAKREAAIAAAQQNYDEAIMLLRNKEFDQAKAKFQDLENNTPNFKSTRQYLSRIDGDKQKAEQDAVLERTHAEQKRLQELEAKRQAEEIAQKAAEEERRKKLREAQEFEIQSLAEKASILNDDILNLSKEHNFNGAKLKFDELEKVMTALQTVKKNFADDEEQMRQREEQEKRNKQEREKAEEAARHKKEDQERKEKARIKAAYEAIDHEPQKAKREEVIAKEDSEQLRQKEIRRHQAEVYRQGVELYNQKKYAAAKVIFDDLANSNYSEAKGYIRKIEAIMLKGELAVKAKAERERTKFIAEQVRKQRLVNIMQQNERIRQQKLTKELEHQKRIAEEEKQQDRMRLEALRLQIKDRQRIEYERRQADRAKQKRDEEYSFRKIAPKKDQKVKNVVAANAIKEEVTETHTVIKEIPKEDDVKADQALPAKEMTEKERKEKIAFSNKRKKFLEDKARKEEEIKQKEKNEEEQKKAKEAKDKDLKEAKEKELKETKDKQEKLKEDRQKELQAQDQQKKKIEQEKVEKERREKEVAQEKAKREKLLAEEKERKVKEAEKLKDLEKKRQEEMAKRQQEKEEQRKADIARKEEIRKKQEELAKAKQERLRIEQEARERQRKLEDERRVIRQKLMEGVKDMYQDALKMYKDGNFTAAAIKFQDVEDLVPDYKQTRAYIIKSRRESLKPPSMPEPINIPMAAVPEKLKVLPMPVQEVPVQAVSSTSTESSARDNAIQKTLDVFDPNAR